MCGPNKIAAQAMKDPYFRGHGEQVNASTFAAEPDRSPANEAHKAVERLERENQDLRDAINRLGDANSQLHTLLHKYAGQAQTAKEFALMLAADLQPKG